LEGWWNVQNWCLIKVWGLWMWWWCHCRGVDLVLSIKCLLPLETRAFRYLCWRGFCWFGPQVRRAFGARYTLMDGGLWWFASVDEGLCVGVPWDLGDKDFRVASAVEVFWLQASASLLEVSQKGKGESMVTKGLDEGAWRGQWLR
jgi:hypothetical protein